MQTGLVDTLAKLADRSLLETERTTLLTSLGSKEHRLEIVLKRNSMTLGRNIPKDYKSGRTLTGKIGKQEVTVLIPKDQKEDVGSLKRGATVILSARYHEFDTFHRRVTFTGSLQTTQTPSEPATIPTVEPLQPFEREPMGEPETTDPEPLPEPPETEENQTTDKLAEHSEPEVEELPPAIEEEKLPAEEDASSPKIVTDQNDLEEPAQTPPLPPREPEPPSVPPQPDPPPSKEPELPSVPRPPFDDAQRGQESIPHEERITKYEAPPPKLDQRKTLVEGGQNIVFWCSCLLWILAIPLTLFLFFKVFLN